MPTSIWNLLMLRITNGALLVANVSA